MIIVPILPQPASPPACLIDLHRNPIKHHFDAARKQTLLGDGKKPMDMIRHDYKCKQSAPVLIPLMHKRIDENSPESGQINPMHDLHIKAFGYVISAKGETYPVAAEISGMRRSRGAPACNTVRSTAGR